MRVQNLLQAAWLEASFYRRVREHKRYNREALGVVLLAAGANGLALGLAALLDRHDLGWAFLGLLGGFWGGLLGWLVLLLLAYSLGRGLFRSRVSRERLLRTLGYAFSPRLLRLLAFVPVVGWVLAVLIWLWSLMATVVALREGLGVEAGPAVVTALLGWLGYIGSGLVVAAIVQMADLWWNMPF